MPSPSYGSPHVEQYASLRARETHACAVSVVVVVVVVVVASVVVVRARVFN